MATQPTQSPIEAPRRRTQRIPVYNPADTPDEIEAGGRPYHFEPRGVTYVEEQRAHVRDEKTNRILTDRAPTQVEGWDAVAVAEYIVSVECRGPKGFIILDGPPDTWEAQKQRARDKWVAFRKAECDALIQSHEANFARAQAAGNPLPRPTSQIKLAYRDRARLEGEGEELVSCPKCNEGFSSDALMHKHVHEIHPREARDLLAGSAEPAAVPVSAPAKADDEDEREAREEQAAAVAAEKQAAPAKVEGSLRQVAQRMPPGSARKMLREEGAKLIQRAKAAGLDLRVGETKALENGDQDTIEDVMVRLAGVETRSQKA